MIYLYDMNQVIRNEAFEPDFNAEINTRMSTFVKLLAHGYHGNLLNQYDLCSTHVAAKQTAAFGFKPTAKLDYKIKEHLFKQFFRHFPDGVQTSLIGYPNMYPPIYN